MHRIKIAAIIALFAMLAAACAGGESTSGEGTPTDGGTTETGTLADFGESTEADAALVAKALGDVGEVPDIVLASIARASQSLDDATIAKAMECWAATECETGSGGEYVMGYADGGGLNVWRQVTRMEAILQALTYPEIGTIVFRDAQWNPDPAVAAGDLQYLIQRGVDFIIGYPDQGTNIASAILDVKNAGIPYIPYSAGYVGLPGTDGALTPGVDYTSIIGEDLCALGTSFADVINTNVGSGSVGVLGGTPGNALSAGWQKCAIEGLNDSIELVGAPADTYWVNDYALQAVLGWLSTDPEIKGYMYEYADGMNTALGAYDELGIPVENLTIALRTDEQTLFCDWADRAASGYKIYYSAGGNFQSRVAVTAAVLYLKGYELPAEITVPHVMREVTPADCNANRVTPTVSGTSLVPDAVLAEMYPNG